MSITIDQKFEKFKKWILISTFGITLPTALFIRIFVEQTKESLITEIFNFVFWIPILFLGIGIGLIWASSIVKKEKEENK
jgi:hypothetical protein